MWIFRSATIATALLVFLKVNAAIDWNWFLIFSPILLFIGAVIAVMVVPIAIEETRNRF
jgi:hypothetical protein